MAISDEARKHLYETLSQQYEPEDARTLITLLGYSTNPDELATKVDLLALARQVDLDEVKADVAVLKTDVGLIRADVDQLKADMATIKTDMATMQLEFARLGEGMKDVVIEQSRTHQRWMFALLTVYTAMAGTLVAIGAIITS
jgi:hypothetical protein